MNNPKINLREYRELKGISERQLSKRTGISQGYISEIEKGYKSPTLRMLYRISDALEICPCTLLCHTIYCKESKHECMEDTTYGI